MSRLWTPILLLAFALPAAALPAPRATDPQLQVEGDTVTLIKSLPFKVVCPEKADDYAWRVPAGWKYAEGDGFINVTAAPEGSHEVGLRALSIDFKAGKVTRKTYSLTVNVGKVDPGPGPGPGPTPDPFGKAKGVGGGLKVLMVWDSKLKSSYPQGQLDILGGKAVRDYLEAHCVQDPRVPTWKAYRMWPSETDATAEHEMWRKVFARPRTSLPWLIVGNGATGYEGALPATPEAMIALLAKYAEGK